MSPEAKRILRETKDSLIANANRSSEESIKQIILIDSAALALIVAFVNSAALRSDIKVLITAAVISFGLSILFGIVEFLNSTSLYRTLHRELDRIVKELTDIPHDQQLSHYEQSRSKLNVTTSGLPPLLCFLFFGVGLILLSAVTLIIIWS